MDLGAVPPEELARPVVEPIAPATGEAGTRLVVVNDTILETHDLPNTGSVVIGRTSDADVCVPHPSVSRRHAVLHLGPELLLEDLSSSNGTTVNNVRIAPLRPVAVRPGDSIHIAHVAVVLQRDWEATQIPGDPHATHNVKPSSASRSKANESGLRTSMDLSVDGNPVVMRTAAMRKVLATVSRVARSNMNVLVLGETGVGKEIIAHAIHSKSVRAEKPFLGINCAALSEPLLESELFGHEKGAFTGAHSTKIGLLEQARGGTVFLDEVGDMSLPIQAKLLRVFEERQVLRVGSLTPRSIDVRIVAATNHDLEAEATAGRFRKDFYFRLNGFSIAIPPLREREDDIAPLAQLFIQMASSQLGLKTAPELATDALDLLMRHAWPGNVRELRNAVERAVVVCDEGPIRAEHIALGGSPAKDGAAASPTPAPTGRHEAAGAPTASSGDLQKDLKELERTKIEEAIRACAGNQTRAAELLGMPRRTLLRKLDAYGIERPRRPKAAGEDSEES
ncbi:sigma 54-interacting transcriptional regulator [bacterium]|nr:sigma 54-interacting transcriptional regulator [bacterium]